MGTDGATADPFPGPFSSEVREDPYPCYRWLLAERPVYHDRERGYWVLSRYADVVAALRNYAVFSQGFGSRDGRGPSMVWSDPPFHTRQRRILSRVFQPAAIEARSPRIEQICHELIDASAVARGRFDFMEDLATPLPLVVMAEVLGLEPARHLVYKRWSRAVMRLLGDPLSEDARHLYGRTSLEFSAYVGAILRGRYAAPRDDLISTLIHTPDEEGPLSPAEVMGACEMLMTGGSEPSSSLFGNAALLLAAHPDQARLVLDDPLLVPALIEEVLRYRGSGQAIVRVTMSEVQFHGVTIPAGAKVALLLAAANLDPEVFPDPDQFLVLRTPNPHVAFGYGVHHCLGAPLARLFGRIVARVLFERFEYLAPDPLAPPRMDLSSPMVRGLESLPMSFALRTSNGR